MHRQLLEEAADTFLPPALDDRPRHYLCEKPVIELPSGVGRRQLTVEQTREYLAEVGQR